jgi:hypothetical protein
MPLWEKLSPTVRKLVIAGAILLGALLVVRYFAGSPTMEHAAQRGIK